ncbi:hypothetical protein SRHO_G00085460 [Serrasalmus rhombeus]
MLTSRPASFSFFYCKVQWSLEELSGEHQHCSGVLKDTQKPLTHALRLDLYILTHHLGLLTQTWTGASVAFMACVITTLKFGRSSE